MKNIEKIEMTGFDKELKTELEFQDQINDSDPGDGMFIHYDEKLNKIARRCVEFYRTPKSRNDVARVLREHFNNADEKLNFMPLFFISINAELLERELSAMGYEF